ncbi:hypothetical protein Q0M94_12725 [Deinococcus radiomollis]|uniref:hypothetical protein n=1 Tax=Deinococcus radiomollis TaxID=468916 RepID=UPI0038929173
MEDEQIYSEATARGLSAKDIRLARQLLPEACAYVFANELGIQLPAEYHLEEFETVTSIDIELDDNFQAALFLAQHLRRSGHRDLFQTLMYPSSIFSSIEEARNTGEEGEELKGIAVKILMVSI